MLKLFISLAIILGSTVQVLAQENEITFTERVKRPAGKLILANDNELLYCAYTMFSKFPYSRTFSRVKVGQGEIEKTVVGADKKKGGLEMPYTYTVSGQYMYELVNHKVGAVNNFSLIQRDLKTLEVVNRVDNVYSFKSMSGYGISIGLDSDDDAVYLEYYDEKKIKKYSEKLELVWETEIPKFEEGVGCGLPRIQDNGVLISNISKTIDLEVATVGYHIWKTDGETLVIQPEIEESFDVRFSKYYFDEDKDELTAVFISPNNFDETDEEKTTTSYVVYKWNSEGEILKVGKHTFTFNDFYGKSNGAVEKIFNKMGIRQKAESDDFLPRLTGEVDVDFRGDGSVIVSFNYMSGLSYIAPDEWKRELEELHMSSFVFSISPDGELDWSRLIAREKDGIHHNVSCVFGSRNVYYLTREFNNSVRDGYYTFEPRKRQLINAETVSPAITVVDLEDQTVEMTLESGSNFIKGDEYLKSDVFDEILIYEYKCAKRTVMFGLRKFD